MDDPNDRDRNQRAQSTPAEAMASPRSHARQKNERLQRPRQQLDCAALIVEGDHSVVVAGVRLAASFGIARWTWPRTGFVS